MLTERLVQCVFLCAASFVLGSVHGAEDVVACDPWVSDLLVSLSLYQSSLKSRRGFGNVFCCRDREREEVSKLCPKNVISPLNLAVLNLHVMYSLDSCKSPERRSLSFAEQCH